MLFRDEKISYTDFDNLSRCTIHRMTLHSVAVDPASLAANTSAETDVTINGVKAGDVVFANTPAALETGLSYGGVRVKADNTVSVRLSNITASPVDGASKTWVFFVIHLS